MTDTASKATKKRQPAKKAGKRAGNTKPAKKTPARQAPVNAGAVEVVGNPPVNDDHISLDEVIAQREEFAERWAEAWRLHSIGIPLRQIGERLGVSHVAARNYVRKHQMLVWGDPNLIGQRADVLARMDQIIEQMSREITTLDATERQKPANRRLPVWLEHGETLSKLLERKWRMMNPDLKGSSKVSVEVGVIPGSNGGGQSRDGMRLPASLQAVLAKVTVDDEAA